MRDSNSIQEDVRHFVESFELSNDLNGVSIIVTGATGLIGSTMLRCLMGIDRNVRIIAPVRNYNKALLVFGDEAGKVEWIECDMSTYDYSQIGGVDYIIHCAAPTSSKFFIEHPVETACFMYESTLSLLEYARRYRVKGFVYLSSLEVYGSELQEGVMITEKMQGYWDPMSVRSSYPIMKRAVENLCCAYVSEYGVPVKIARLTQTAGAGVAKDDNRIMVQFARQTAKNEDIVLRTTGESARSYCYTIDCVSAILYILLRGNSGEAYNVANEQTYISARDMAGFLRNNFNPKISVCFDLNDNCGYAPVSKLNISTEKLRGLGWEPRYDLKCIFTRLLKYLSENES